MSAAPTIRICASADLVEGGKGVRFPVQARFGATTGFVVRYDGIVRGYLNQCAHVPVELDWRPGEYFDSSGLYLICTVHGAMYEPDSGRCAGGPCRGGRLRALAVLEREESVYWQPDDVVRAVPLPEIALVAALAADVSPNLTPNVASNVAPNVAPVAVPVIFQPHPVKK